MPGSENSTVLSDSRPKARIILLAGMKVENSITEFLSRIFITRMNKKLYVGGLPYSSTDDALKEAFSAAGNVVSASIIVDKMSGRSKGFGFVEMSTEEEATKAIEMFNGKDFEGRTITVNEARPMEPRAPRQGGGFNRGGGRGFGGGRQNNW